MTWHDFLKYSKFIAIFYAIAFALALIGIWSSTGVNFRFVWSGVLFGAAALIANVALGVYHANHRTEMSLEKNIYMAKQEGSQVITGDGKELQAGAQFDMEHQIRRIARKAVDDERYGR